MNNNSMILILFILTITWASFLSPVYGGSEVAKFKIEGLISPASPKALTAGLEEKLAVKVLDLNLKNTDSGWPVLSVQHNPDEVSIEKIEQMIASTEDPAGHKYQVHKGPLIANAPLLEEEQQAIAKLGPTPQEFQQLKNPMTDSVESANRGKTQFEKYCAKCHGLNGNGYGTVSHGFTTWPRQLWAWNKTGAESDGYLYWYITNGRTDMPPWGIILSENERWDLINYIKSMKPPAQ